MHGDVVPCEDNLRGLEGVFLRELKTEGKFLIRVERGGGAGDLQPPKYTI